MYMGAVAGIMAGGTIMNVASTVTTFTGETGSANTGNTIVGGLVGYIYNFGTIRNCYTTGNISAISANRNSTVYCGGIVGWMAGMAYPYCKIEYCYSSGTVSAWNTADNTASAYSGGIVGQAYNAFGATQFNFITRCVAAVTTVRTTRNNGDIVGRVLGYGINMSVYYPAVGFTSNYANSSMMKLYLAGASTGALSASVTNSTTDKDGGNVTSANLGTSTWWNSTTAWSSVWGTTEDLPWKWPSSGTRPVLWFE